MLGSTEHTMNRVMIELTGTEIDRDEYDHYVFIISEAILRIIEAGNLK